MLHFLPDGTPLVIRPIRAADKDRIATGLSRLSAETIRRRFLAAKPRLTASELAYLTEIDGYSHIGLVAIDPADPAGVVAVARCVRLPDDRRTAEWAIVIADHLQGRGLGKLLISELAARARRAGVERFSAVMLEENVAARRLLDHVSAGLERDEHRGGVREIVVGLAA